MAEAIENAIQSFLSGSAGEAFERKYVPKLKAKTKGFFCFGVYRPTKDKVIVQVNIKDFSVSIYAYFDFGVTFAEVGIPAKNRVSGSRGVEYTIVKIH